MALSASTGSQEPNPQMKPAPDKAAAAAKQAADAKAASDAQQKALEAGEPWLDPDDEGVDWVILLRMYPHARSKDELRSIAMKAGKEALAAAAKAQANVDLPLPEPSQAA